jgi:hypothetical protein
LDFAYTLFPENNMFQSIADTFKAAHAALTTVDDFLLQKLFTYKATRGYALQALMGRAVFSNFQIETYLPQVVRCFSHDTNMYVRHDAKALFKRTVENNPGALNAALLMDVFAYKNMRGYALDKLSERLGSGDFQAEDFLQQVTACLSSRHEEVRHKAMKMIRVIADTKPDLIDPYKDMIEACAHEVDQKGWRIPLALLGLDVLDQLPSVIEARMKEFAERTKCIELLEGQGTETMMNSYAFNSSGHIEDVRISNTGMVCRGKPCVRSRVFQDSALKK